MELLDCTIRDGGYYNLWDFEDALVKEYLKLTNQISLSYLEIGYRSPKLPEYCGKYFYLDNSTLDRIKNDSDHRLAIILNEKDVKVTEVESLLSPTIGKVDLVRLAVDPKNLERALELSEKIKNMGFLTALNVMYFSKWINDSTISQKVIEGQHCFDYFYCVDSFGSCYPNETGNYMREIRPFIHKKIGFHGHNNLELALANTIEAIDAGADIVDSTILGMGRGAGNTKTEYLLLYLHKQGLLKGLNIGIVNNLVELFKPLLNQYGWGTNFPYALAGVMSFPQKQIMHWLVNRGFSASQIIKTLDPSAEKDEKYVNLSRGNYKKAIIIGGGPSVLSHLTHINYFIESLQESDATIIFSSSKFANYIESDHLDTFYVLTGDEVKRLSASKEILKDNEYVLLPPVPREITISVENIRADKVLSVNKSSLSYPDSRTGIALQAAIDLGVNEAIVIGYDGYHDSHNISNKEITLYRENIEMFKQLRECKGIKSYSLLPNPYNLDVVSLYSFFV